MSSILMMGMSLRKGSFNKKFIHSAFESLTAKGESAELLSFNDYPMEVFNADTESDTGIPTSVKELGKKISEARALIFSTPEYNGAMPGPFKNAFDWISRIKPMPWERKHVLLLGASPGGLGATRGLWHSRVTFEAAGSFVFPEMMGLSAAHEAFDEDGKLNDSKQQDRLDKLLQKYLDHL